MKKYLTIVVLTFCSTFAFSQENQPDQMSQKIIEKSRALHQLGDNEIRLNIAYAIAGYPEINYERFLADNMGVGFAAAVSFEKAENMYNRYSFLPYARLYFGEKKSSGFFIETNLGLIGYKTIENYITDTFSIVTKTISTVNVGFGVAAGAKFLARNGFVGEIYGGLGRLFGDNAINGAYPRLGICLGKRF